uniref:Notch n=1 Tax=Panagrolaimus sp. PS1159 TaxID=55785 RepID=A0AC35GEY8_9BILA
DKAAKCTDTVDSYTCQCPANSKDISPNQAFPGRVCLVFEDECLTGKHDCDQNAMCHDNEQSFTCECKTGFTDRSPNKLTRPGRVCVKLVDECAENRHTCSAQAECRDLEEGYTCECKEGYIDRSPNLLTQPGRVCGTPEVCPSNHECSSAAVCEPLGGNKYQCTCIQGYIDQSPQGTQGRICVRNNACKDPRLNNCSRNAICYDEPKGYRSGYVDRSPDVSNKPGRVCVLTEPICLDSNRNDCDPAAICSETQDADGYTCRCRDGYVDQSPDTNRRPGRICVAQVNECLDKSLNDCDALAVCEDLPDGYTCRCPVNSIDQSPDSKRPGRKCFLQVDECANPSLNNCSRFADCMDKKEGYECKCRSGYHDENPAHPGTVCNYIINECESPTLNDCHRHADCMDLPGGYTCRCKSPYRDEGPRDHPGRVCHFNECASPSTNKCDKNAVCQDTEDGYRCICKEGFYDPSANPEEAGHVCTEFQQPGPVTVLPIQTPQHEGIPCGPNNYCVVARNEVCIGGNRCGCRPGEARASLTDKCQPVEKIPLAVRVVSQGQEPLYYSSEYGNDQNEKYAEFTNEFKNDVGRAIGSTSYAPRYVNTDVSFITHPKTVNSSWPDGLLLNFTVGASPSGNPIDVCDLWDQFMNSVQRTNGAIGGGRLNVASDVDLLDPCYKPPPAGDLCNGQVCKAELGEVCIAGSICGCVNGEKRASPKDKCRPVESFPVPLWVIRKNQNNLVYNETFGNPLDSLNKEYVKSFEKGVAECYPHTVLKNAFVTAEVNDIVDPMVVNASMDTGIYYNATMYFRKGQVRIPSDAYHTLLRYIIDRNNYQIGNSGLYINPYQPDPYSACYKNSCHPKGRCIELGPNAYRCECGAGYRDKNPNDPGHHCLPINNFNECENPEDNEC